MLLPAFPFMPLVAAVPLAVLLVWPRARRRLKAVGCLMLPLGLGFWLIHGGVFASWIGGAPAEVPGRGLWALGLWLRILSVVSSSQVWMEYVPAPALVRNLLSGSLPVSLGFLLASPLLLAEQIKTRLSQIREAQLARGIPVQGTLRERLSALTALIFPLILGLLNDLPARGAALDMKAFKLFPYRNSLCRDPGKQRIAPAAEEERRYGETELSVDIRDGVFFSPESADPLLRISRFQLHSGSWALIRGGNGSGKSTLAMILSGGVPEHRAGTLEGDFGVDGVPVSSKNSLGWSARTQFVQQNPALCFSGCTFTVEEEIAFGPENLALAQPEIRERIGEAMAVTGAAHLRERPLVQLSGGEAQKVLLAAALAMRPRLLLLDEVFSRVQADDIPAIVSRMKEWGRKYGVSVIAFEREGFALTPFCDVFARLEEGRLVSGAANAGRVWPDLAVRDAPETPNDKGGLPSAVLTIKNVDFSWSGSSAPLLEGLNEEIFSGGRVALTGANGAGKSTLLRLCGGLLAPTNGELLLNGESIRSIPPGRRASRIGFLFQDPERQIFHSSVEAEVLFSLRGAKLSEDEKNARLESALRITGLEGKEKRHPLDLNSAERRMVALASLSVQDRELLLLDEPTRELDDYWLGLFLRWLAAQSAVILAISHDPELVARVFQRCWLLQDGHIDNRKTLGRVQGGALS